ncbi:hypothetical protein ACRRTK_005772 [Alexandromys fortis]
MPPGSSFHLGSEILRTAGVQNRPPPLDPDCPPTRGPPLLLPAATPPLDPDRPPTQGPTCSLPAATPPLDPDRPSTQGVTRGRREGKSSDYCFGKFLRASARPVSWSQEFQKSEAQKQCLRSRINEARADCRVFSCSLESSPVADKPSAVLSYLPPEPPVSSSNSVASFTYYILPRCCSGTSTSGKPRTWSQKFLIEGPDKAPPNKKITRTGGPGNSQDLETRVPTLPKNLSPKQEKPQSPGVPGLTHPLHEVPSQNWLWESECEQMEREEPVLSITEVPDASGDRRQDIHPTPSAKKLGPACSGEAKNLGARKSIRTWHWHQMSF